jgi:glycerol kinase
VLDAACLARLVVGYWDGTKGISENWRLERALTLRMDEGERGRRHARCLEAVERARGWATQ